MFIKASITGVDIRRGVCKCRRETDGFTLVNVTWMDEAPSEGDPVWLFNSDGHFVVLGKRSRPGAVPEHIPSLTTSSATSPVGDIASIGTTTFGQGTSPDEVSGDKVVRSKGGAIIAALRGGSVIAKASHWAWVFISRFDHVVKIFSRNYEKHNEARSEVNVNANGKVFSVEENYTSQSKAREGIAEHTIITGDVDAGEELGINYRNDYSSDVPSIGVRRENVTVDDVRRFQSDLTLLGEETEVSRNESSSSVVTKEHLNTKYRITLVSNGVTQVIEVDPGKILLDSGSSTSLLELKPDGTVLIKGMVATVDVPNTTFTGNVAVLGNVGVLGSVAVTQGLSVLGTSTMSSTITLTDGADVVSDTGVTLLTHNHTTNVASGTHSHTVNAPIPG